jgi:methanol--5-hydroxybenzimidazolylcobamide Co-methyltransferase
MEQLVYDCRVMNRARADGSDAARTLQRWLVDSDVATDPQAFIISPATAVTLAKAIVSSDSHYHAGVAVARTAIDLMRTAHESGKLHIAENEVDWLDNMTDALDELPENEDAFIAQQLALTDPSRFIAAEYGL